MDYLSEEVFNDLVDSVAPAIESDPNVQANAWDEDNLNKVASHIIGAVLGKGYSLMALTTMLMRYQMKIGLMHQDESTGVNTTVIILPESNPFEP
jgi:hypothetical protein